MAVNPALMSSLSLGTSRKQSQPEAAVSTAAPTAKRHKNHLPIKTHDKMIYTVWKQREKFSYDYYVPEDPFTSKLIKMYRSLHDANIRVRVEFEKWSMKHRHEDPFSLVTEYDLTSAKPHFWEAPLEGDNEEEGRGTRVHVKEEIVKRHGSEYERRWEWKLPGEESDSYEDEDDDEESHEEESEEEEPKLSPEELKLLRE